MKKHLSKAVVVLGITIAAFQQGAWWANGYHASVSFGQVMISLVWSLTIIGVSVMISKSIKKNI